MAVFTEGQYGADEGQPYEEVSRQFFRDIDAGIHRVTHDNVDEDHDRHAGEQQDENDFENPVKEIDGLLHFPLPKKYLEHFRRRIALNAPPMGFRNSGRKTAMQFCWIA
jgi:hypothetical protein